MKEKYTDHARRYSDLEKKVIIKHISKNANNLTVAFELAAEELGRSVAGIRGHYQNKLRHDTSTRFMVLATSQGMMINCKNSPRRVKMGEAEDTMNLEVMKFMSTSLTRAEKMDMIKSLLKD